VLSQHLFVREQAPGNGLPQHGHRRVAAHVGRREEAAARHRPGARRGEVRAGRVGLRLVIGAAEARGHAAAELGHRRQHVGQPRDRLGVLRHQGGDAAAAPGHVRRARPHQQKVGAHAADALEHLLLGAVAHRQHGDHRAYADDDAEQRKRGAEHVGAQRRAGRFGGFDQAAQLGIALNYSSFRRNNRAARPGIVHDAPIGDLDDALRLLGDLACVRDDDHGVACGGKLAQQRHHFPTALAVERAGGLVGEDDAPAVHQGARDRYALLLAARELAGAVVQALGEPELAEQRLGAGAPLGAAHAGVDRGHFDVAHGARVGDQVIALEHETECFAAQARELVAAERRHILSHEAVAAAGRAVEAAEDVHQRRLARARRAHDGDELPRVDRQVDAVQHLDRELAAAVGLDDFVELDHRRGPIFGVGAAEAARALARGRSLVATRSPGARPETICTVTRLLTPTSTARSSWPPSGPSTRTVVRPSALRRNAL
jgi:hypothetical protein